jgi:uncharacterized membrane protein
MTPADRALVDELRLQPPGTTIIEAVGPAYSEFARLSSASGVPALLGWENHELVWRGPTVTPETTRRRELVAAVYAAEDPDDVARLARSVGVDLIAVGSLERRIADDATVEAIRSAGSVLVDRDGALLVRIAPDPPGNGSSTP